MKKTTLMTAFIGMTIFASAQKNSIIVLGNVGLNITATDDTTRNKSHAGIFVFNPAVGYQVSEKWAIGIVGEIQRSSYRTEIAGTPGTVQKGNMTTTGGGVFGRLSLPISNMLFVAIQNELIYKTLTASGNGAGRPGLYHEATLNVIPNLGIRIKKGYAVNLSFGNLTASYGKTREGSHNYGLNSNLGRGVMFGFTKNFISHKRSVAAEG
jgi:hypothetical protein